MCCVTVSVGIGVFTGCGKDPSGRESTDLMEDISPRKAGAAVDSDLLQVNADWYGADIYKEPFGSSFCKTDQWLGKRTYRLIKEVISEIPVDAVMYLANALAFGAEWESIYNEDQVREDIFTKEDGTRQPVDFMYSEGSGYLRDDHASGFLKYYADRTYAFAALLPDEGMDIEDHVASLTGERLKDVLQDVEGETVYLDRPFVLMLIDCGANIPVSIGEVKDIDG